MAQLTEEEAFALASEAVDLAGGTREVYRNPRHPFSRDARQDYLIDGVEVELIRGEVSSPAVVSVGGWVFEIHDGSIDLLIQPPAPRAQTD